MKNKIAAICMTLIMVVSIKDAFATIDSFIMSDLATNFKIAVSKDNPIISSHANIFVLKGQNIRLDIIGDFVDVCDRVEISPSSAAGIAGGLIKSKDAVTGKGKLRFQLNISSSLVRNTIFQIRIRYLVEVNGYDYISCVVAERGTITEVHFVRYSGDASSSLPPVINSRILIEPNRQYYLELKGTGLANSQPSNFAGVPKFGAVPLVEGVFIQKVSSDASTLLLKVSCGILGPDELDNGFPHGNVADVCDVLCNFKGEWVFNARYNRQNMTSPVISGKLSTTMVDWAVGSGVSVIPDLTPVNTNPFVLFRPLNTSFSLDGQGKVYFRVNDQFCSGLGSKTAVTQLNDVKMGTILEYVVPLNGSYGIKNKGTTFNASTFDTKVVRFKNESDVYKDSLGITQSTFTVSSGNFPVHDATLTTSFNRPPAHIYTIATLPGCYLRRDSQTTIGPDEEGAYMITVDSKCYTMSSLGKKLICLRPNSYNNVREAREYNNDLPITR